MDDKQESNRRWFYNFLRRNGASADRVDALAELYQPFFTVIADYHAWQRGTAFRFPLPDETEVERIASRMLPTISTLTGEMAVRLVPISASRPMLRPEWMSEGGYASAMRAAVGESLGTSLMASVLPEFLAGRTDEDHVRRTHLYEALNHCLGVGTTGYRGLLAHTLDWGTSLHESLNRRFVCQCSQALNRCLFHHSALTLEGRHEEADLFANLLTQPYAPVAGRLISGRHKPRPYVPGNWYVLAR